MKTFSFLNSNLSIWTRRGVELSFISLIWVLIDLGYFFFFPEDLYSFVILLIIPGLLLVVSSLLLLIGLLYSLRMTPREKNIIFSIISIVINFGVFWLLTAGVWLVAGFANSGALTQ